MGSANVLNMHGSQLILFAVCLFTIIWITGCRSLPRAQESWTEVNPVQTAESGAIPTRQTELHDLPAAVSKKPPVKRPIAGSIRWAVEQFVPGSYRVDIEEGIDLNAVIQMDPSENWLEALGTGMSSANIELFTNISKKTLFLRKKKIVLAEVIEKFLPNDFTVFSHADINLQTLIHFDTRDHWVQAFNKATAGTDIDLTVDFANKVISLKPKYQHDAHLVAAGVGH